MLLNYHENLPACIYYVQLIGKLCFIEKYAFLSELFILEKCNTEWWRNIWWWMTVWPIFMKSPIFDSFFNSFSIKNWSGKWNENWPKILTVSIPNAALRYRPDQHQLALPSQLLRPAPARLRFPAGSLVLEMHLSLGRAFWDEIQH